MSNWEFPRKANHRGPLCLLQLALSYFLRLHSEQKGRDNGAMNAGQTGVKT